MSKTLRLGLIGCGLLGRTHAACMTGIPGGRFAAYADASLQAAQTTLDEFGGDYATDDVQRLWDDADLDAVYICTQHDSHASLAIAAARAGKHIFIEKPLALTAADCESIAQAVRENGIRMMPGFKMRYYPLIRRAHEFIPTPQVMVMQMMDERWADHHWAQDPVQGGANVYSQGCHSTDIIRYLGGSEPVRLWATGGSLTHPGHPCIDQCIASIQLQNGHVVSWIQGDAGLGPFTSKFFIQLFGASASGEPGCSVQLHDRCRKAVFSAAGRTWTEERTEEEGFLLENQAFVQALLSDTEPEITAYDGIQATRIVLAADRAIRTGEVQILTSHGHLVRTERK